MDQFGNTDQKESRLGDTIEPSNGCFPVSAEYHILKGNKKKASLQNFKGPIFEMVILLEGTADIHLEKEGKDTRCLNVSSGMFFLHLNHGQWRSSITPQNRTAKILHLFYECNSLYSFIGVKDFRPAHSNIRTETMASGIVAPPPPTMSSIIADIYLLLENNKNDKMHLTLKALELLWVFFSSDFSKPEKKINSNDLIAIRKSVDILKNNLGSPPCLNELAKSVGMSASKFKILFPKIYGMPPYEYLRQKKMEKAMSLLLNSEMNVTEVAMEVGYNSLSHFSKAFFKAHRIKPSRVGKHKR